MPGGGYVMSFTDITEEARVREELRQTLDELEMRVTDRTRELSEANRRLAIADREKTRFLAAASHDLLQPLHAARLFTAALERDAAEAAKTLVHRVDSAIVAAEDLLRALLDISKIDAGGVTPQPEPVSLDEFLSDLTESFRPLARESALELRLGPCPGAVMTDPGLLRSIMQNFLTNALRYTEHGGILIGTRRRGDKWRIDVVDTGVGIEPDLIETIFGEFTRLGRVEVEGLGLGLALVERISRLLGGKIEVASAPGKGSRFSLLLPVSETRALPAELGQALVQDALVADRRLNILVVDNDPLIVEATSALLAAMGHRAHDASTITAALSKCDGIDAMLIDYRLDDGEDGLALIEAVRERRPDLPALLVTAETDMAMRNRAMVMGVEVVAKPVDPSMISRFLSTV